MLSHNEQPKLYFVLETKGSVSEENLRPTEFAKIKCGTAHFNSIDTGVEFKAVDNFNQFMNNAISKN